MDKDKEKKIFNMVYGDERFTKVIPSEKPDFIATTKHYNTIFGVEITELYFSESNARLSNIRDYFTDILDQKKYRHKKDKKLLKVEEVTLCRGDKKYAKVPGIVKELPKVNEYVTMVNQRIREKSQNLSDYQNNLTHINLIIYDSEHRLFEIKAEDFYNLFYTKEMRVSLFKSSYNEIFFVTCIEKNRWVYIPLILLLLLGELHLINGVLTTYYKNQNYSPSQQLLLFSKYLGQVTTIKVITHIENDQLEVLNRGYGFLVDEKKGVIVRDYADGPIPENSQIRGIKKSDSILPSDFLDNIEKYRKNHIFECNLLHNIRSNTLSKY